MQETVYAADGSVESMELVVDRQPKCHNYSHGGVQLQLQQMELGANGATAEERREMATPMKMVRTMSLDDISS